MAVKVKVRESGAQPEKASPPSLMSDLAQASASLCDVTAHKRCYINSFPPLLPLMLDA